MDRHEIVWNIAYLMRAYANSALEELAFRRLAERLGIEEDLDSLLREWNAGEQ